MKNILVTLVLLVISHLNSFSQFIDCQFQLDVDTNATSTVIFTGPVNNYSPNLYNYQWTFGDGNSLIATSGLHAYSNAGVYTICMNVIEVNSGANICSYCDSVQISLNNTSCDFTYFPAPNGLLTYGFYAQVDTLNSQYVNWIINGETILPTVSSNIYTSYTFPGPGVYPVTMNYFDANGELLCTATQNIEILQQIENCDFIVTQNSNQNYTFSPNFIGQPANGYYSVTINGVALDTSYTGNYNYTLQPGNNLVCMTTTYLNGTPSCTSCEDIFVSLNPNDSLGCYISAIPDQVNPYFYSFYLGAPNNLLWTIAGPNGFTETITQCNSSQFFYTFPSDGVFNVSLTASDSLGNVLCTNGYNITILGNPSNCNADFYAAASPLTGYFIDMSTGIDPQTTNYFWNFGDGGTSTERFPFHTYDNGGYYTISLTIVNGNCIDTTTQFVYIFDNDTNIVVNDCNAYLIVTQTEPYSVNIVNLSSGNNLNFSWSFANGTSLNTPFPTLQIPFASNFIFCLTVSNSFCFSTYCDSLSFDSLGTLQRTTEMLNINVVSPQEITGYNLNALKESQESIANANYPNPFSENFTIDNANGKFNTYSIMTIDGREIVNGSLSKGIEVVQTNEWSNGVYFLKLNSQNGISNTSKIVKK